MSKLSIDGHKELAKKIKLIHRTFNELLIAAGNVYGVSSREVSLINRSKAQFSQLRSQLDSDVTLENPKQPLTVTGFYYHTEEVVA